MSAAFTKAGLEKRKLRLRLTFLDKNLRFYLDESTKRLRKEDLHLKSELDLDDPINCIQKRFESWSLAQ